MLGPNPRRTCPLANGLQQGVTVSKVTKHLEHPARWTKGSGMEGQRLLNQRVGFQKMLLRSGKVVIGVGTSPRLNLDRRADRLKRPGPEPRILLCQPQVPRTSLFLLGKWQASALCAAIVGAQQDIQQIGLFVGGFKCLPPPPPSSTPNHELPQICSQKSNALKRRLLLAWVEGWATP